MQENQVRSCLGRYPGEGNGNTLQYSCLENPMDRGAWRATVHGVAKNQDTTKQLMLSLRKTEGSTEVTQDLNLTPEKHKGKYNSLSAVTAYSDSNWVSTDKLSVCSTVVCDHFHLPIVSAGLPEHSTPLGPAPHTPAAPPHPTPTMPPLQNCSLGTPRQSSGWILYFHCRGPRFHP